MLLYGIYAAKYPLQNFVCQQHCPQPRVMKCTRFYITTILYIVSEMNVAAKQVDFISIRARLWNGNYGGGRFLLQERVAAHEVFIGGRRHGDHECFFGENENKLVLSCELRSGPVWVIFFPSFQAPCIHTYAITTNWLNRCQHVKIWECNVMKTGIFHQVAKQ